MMFESTLTIKTDVLIIGGGTAGCMAAIMAKRREPKLAVTILEKAHLSRSGCLAMGLNAVNAHLTEGTPQDYADYVRRDNYGIVREDLVLSIGERLNRMTGLLEEIGVPLPRDGQGNYIARSKRSIVMLGEHLKPLLARAVRAAGVRVENRTPVYRLLQTGDGRVCGAAGFNLRSGKMVVVHARAVLIATGGASGIYRPSNPGLARTKTWYCPYNAGSGLAMGLRAGAEMTSFEMRFVALRTKDVIAPTGTLVLGARMPQCNARGERYIRQKEQMLGRSLTTCERLQFTIDEHRKGTGPCYVDVSGLSADEYRDLVESYLNMSPSIALDLLQDTGRPKTHIEICGSEPYVNGGHGMAGFWIDADRRTTLPGLYAAGDVAGGAPKKYITGCFAEAEMAVEHIIGSLHGAAACAAACAEQALGDLRSCLAAENRLAFDEVEARLQKIMEEYAGGSTENYETSRNKLLLARRYLDVLSGHAVEVTAADGHGLMRVHDTFDRILLAKVLVEHLLARRETRWPCYQTRLDFPLRNDFEYSLFVNSTLKDGAVKVFGRSLDPPYEPVPFEETL
jgi:adenylylsulfate reductase, subunit A